MGGGKGGKIKALIAYLAIIALLLLALFSVLNFMGGDKTVEEYSSVIKYFDTYEVKAYKINLGSGELQYKLRGETEAQPPHTYSVPWVTFFINDINAADANGVASSYRKNYAEHHKNDANPEERFIHEDFVPVQNNTFLTNFLPYLLLIGLMIGFTFIVMRQTTGGGRIANFSKTAAKQSMNAKKTTFKDVAGADEELAELSEIVDFLKKPKKYRDLGARIPKGVLLVGPPGTGKTLLAKAVAGEADVPFYSISGSDFVEMFVGVGASRVRDLFDQAKKKTPAIIFIDEIDAVGRHRGAGLGGGHDEREQTLNQLLVEMDGFNDNENIIIIAATNRRDILDPALLRPGRFDRQVVVNYPDIKGREAILAIHVRNKVLGPDVELPVIAKTTAGFTGADLENLLNEAALLAARVDKTAITMTEVREATIKVIAGPEKKSRVISEKERKLTAFHEAGHALCTYFCETQDKVHQISIIPRGTAGGYTMSLPEHDKMYGSKREYEEELVTLLGGRVAESLTMDDLSTGASNDIARATTLARSMVTRYGFSDKLGPILYGHESAEVFLGRDYSQGKNYSDSIAAEIDTEIRVLVDKSYKQAEKILRANMQKLHEVAQELIKRERLESEDFEAIMKNATPAADVTPGVATPATPATPVTPTADPAEASDTGKDWIV
ncbi:ATP-dependent zinc metalloprotease FtsH [Clostridia bacterium]|nr:ATP-dependent zinc metalloprotease FtsH [Clostridia bacterium]